MRRVARELVDYKASIHSQSINMNARLTTLFVLSCCLLLCGAAAETSYGVDVSFPCHHGFATSSASDLPLEDRRQAYLNHLEGCRQAYPGNSLCDSREYTRLTMNKRQPMSMTNYTDTGFLKIRALDSIVDLVSEFWQKNYFKGKEERWPEGDSIFNHWESPTYHVSVDDHTLRGSGARLKEQIWAAAAATLEKWTSQELQPVSLYGIRVYSEGAVMLPHVDRLPLVASALLCVASDLDEDWPFEVYDHDGKAHNVTLEPGEMLLMETHSVIHGHPWPLKGRSYAMIFLHFEPTGNPLEYHSTKGFQKIDKQYKKSVKEGIGGQSSEVISGLPPYIQRESPEEANWRALHPEGWQPVRCLSFCQS